MSLSKCVEYDCFLYLSLIHIYLSPDELRAALTEIGWSVRKLLSLRPAKHIFTHVEWHMNGVYVELDAPAPALTFVTPAELRNAYALPSAFRSFVSVLRCV